MTSRPPHFLRLILLNQSIASLGHAGARGFICRSSVKIGVAERDVGLSLLNESRDIRYSSTVCSDPSHFGRSGDCSLSTHSTATPSTWSMRSPGA